MPPKPRPKLPLSVFASQPSSSSQVPPSSYFSPDSASVNPFSGGASTANLDSPRKGHPGFPIEVVDSHVHFWEIEDVRDRLGWMKEGGALEVLMEERGHGWERYGGIARGALGIRGGGKGPESARGIEGKTSMKGFVYVQSDVDHDDSDVDGTKGGWDHSIREVDILATNATKYLFPQLLAIVPWAPVPAGPAALQDYVSRLLSLPSLLSLSTSSLSLSRQVEPSTSSATPSPIKGFRYIVQTSPKNTVLENPFIEGLKWLGAKGYLFEFVVDSTKGPHGRVDLDTVLDCISLVRADQSEQQQTVFVLDHFGKPDLSAPVNGLNHEFAQHASFLREFSLFPNFYLKLSGLLSQTNPGQLQAAFSDYLAINHSEALLGHYESPGGVVSLSQQQAQRNRGHSRQSSSVVSPYSQLKKSIKLFLEIALEAFGDERLLFGSDWPMFRKELFPSTLSYPSKEVQDALDAASFEFQFELYRESLSEVGLDGAALDRVFSGNAAKVYGI